MQRTKRQLQAPQVLLISVLALLCPRNVLAESIVLGTINNLDPLGEIEKMTPLAKYLAAQLHSNGIDDGRVVVARSMNEMAGFLREGKADVFIDSVFPSLVVSRLSGSKLLLRRWKKGRGDYHAVVFVRKDSGITRLEELKGKRIAFEEEFSSSGYLFPKVLLIQKGLKPVPTERDFAALKPGEVGYVFSSDDWNTLLWVVRGKVHAGAMDNQTFQQRGRPYYDQLSVIAESPSMPRQVVSVRSSLPAALAARIRDLLVKMNQSEQGKKVLQAFEATTRFDELSPQALADIATIGRYASADAKAR